MLNKTMACCTSLGAGIAMLIGIGAGIAGGNATAATIEVACRPGVFDSVYETLKLALLKINIPLFAAFAVAVILLILSRCFSRACTKTCACSCIYGAVSAGIAMLGGIGAAIGIGRAAAVLPGAIANQPAAKELFMKIFETGTCWMMLCVWTSVIIAAGIILCMICSACRCRCQYFDICEED